MQNRLSRWLKRLLPPAMLSLCAAAPAQAQVFCVYDPLGQGGDYYSMFQDYQLAAKRWNVSIDLKVYTDDAKLRDDFKGGRCDMASMIGMRAREFNIFTGTLDAPSVLENYSQERQAMGLVASPKLAKYMVNDGYEVVGVVPIGASYVITRDRYINSFDHAVGKKVAIMGWDKTQTLMANDFKAVPVPMEITQFASAFNGGKVDFIVVPIALYKALELSKGVGTTGGIVHRPLFIFTMQIVAHADKFPASFGQQSREYMLGQCDHALSIAHNQEAAVEQSTWIYALHQEIVRWDTTMAAALDHMTREGHYDRRMLNMLARVRCKSNPDGLGCAAVLQQAPATTTQ